MVRSYPISAPMTLYDLRLLVREFDIAHVI